MAIISRSYLSESGIPQELDPLSAFGDLILPIAGDKDRWVYLAFGTGHADLLDKALREYVATTDSWMENRDDHDIDQERRLAFIRLLQTISAASEDLAKETVRSYTDHQHKGN